MCCQKGCWSWRGLSTTAAAAATAKSLQLCPTLCDPIDGSPPGSLVPGILQARTLEWVVISFSNAWKWKVKVKLLSPVQLLVTPWTAAYQAPPSMGFSRQEYWSGVPSPSPLSTTKPRKLWSSASRSKGTVCLTKNTSTATENWTQKTVVTAKIFTENIIILEGLATNDISTQNNENALLNCYKTLM